MDYPIIPMPPDLWPEVREIYREGIATGNATFEIEVPDWEEWNNSHRQDCRLVALQPNKADADEPVVRLIGASVLGWAALSPISARHVCRGVAEVSVYVAAAARGRGVGRALLLALIHESELKGIWTLQAGIFAENAGSLALHGSCGFGKVGVRRNIGKLGDRWRDVILLERRSTVVGL